MYIIYNWIIITVQTFGVGKIFQMFLKGSYLLTKVAFILYKKKKKNC